MPNAVALPVALVSALLLTGCASAPREAPPAAPPNVIVLFVDDMGWGDLSCFGHPTIRTPHLDAMADTGIRFTQFYSAAPVCTPSRAALLTGRLPVRSGMCSSRRRVLFPNSKGGLPAREITLAEALRDRGYATACIGKWHLGHRKPYMPLAHGFDRYYGLPYSNDMDRVRSAPRGRQAFREPKSQYWNVPLIRDHEIIERPAQQETLTQRYTAAAVEFIEQSADRPFFLYLPYSMVHVPLFASAAYRGKSAGGLYGDTVEEIDGSVGTIRSALRDAGVADNTLIFFTSDNGPWLTFGDHGGTAGHLRAGKGSTFEGGMRVPTIAHWPAGIRAPGRVSDALGSTMDIFTTCVRLAGGEVPADRVIDGVDLRSVFLTADASPRKAVFYYRGTELWAVRNGDFKAHFKTRLGYTRQPAVTHDPPLLYDLAQDPSEKVDVAGQHPAELVAIRRLVAAHRASLESVKNQLHQP